MGRFELAFVPEGEGWRIPAAGPKLPDMKHLLPLSALLTLSACATGPGYDGPRLKPAANPSAVIATELAFARQAQVQGQWTAFRATSTSDAVMFVPGRVNAQTWLKGRADPPVSVKWQPHVVWSSCDGSYAATIGDWNSGNARGTFVTVWQRQGERRGQKPQYKWVLDMSVTNDNSAPMPDSVTAKVADCTSPALRPPPSPLAGGSDSAQAYATDQSLRWTSTVRPDRSRTIQVEAWLEGAYQPVIELDGRDVE